MVKSGYCILYLHFKNHDCKMLEMIGVHDCKVDIKGRFMLPTALKSQLEAFEQNGFIIKRSIFQQCLEIYPRSEWNEAVKGINKLNRFIKKNNDFIRVFMAGVREVEMDSIGRIQIPKDLAIFADINKDIVIASALNIIEVWDKEKYEQAIADNQDNFSLLAEEVMGQISQ